MEDTLEASVDGDVITINGEAIDLSGIPVHWDSPEEFRNPLVPIVLDVVDGAVPFPDTSPPVLEPTPLPEEPEDG